MTDTLTKYVQAIQLEAMALNASQLHHIQRIALEHPSGHDGYPSGGQDGPRGNSELTPTERAASGRMGRRQTDEIRDLALGVTTDAKTVLKALRRMNDAHKRMEALRTVKAEGGNDSWCWVAQQYGFSYDPIWTTHCHTTFDGYLAEPWPEPRPVCRQVYDRTRALRVLPSADELGSYLRRSVA